MSSILSPRKRALEEKFVVTARSKKTKLEMLVEMQIEILAGDEILVNCTFKFNQKLNLDLYREIQRNSNKSKISIREIPGNWRYSIWTS